MQLISICDAAVLQLCGYLLIGLCDWSHAPIWMALSLSMVESIAPIPLALFIRTPVQFPLLLLSATQKFMVLLFQYTVSIQPKLKSNSLFLHVDYCVLCRWENNIFALGSKPSTALFKVTSLFESSVICCVGISMG